MPKMLSDILTASVIASAIRLATPYIFAGMGETFGQRSGVLNLGVDGIMLLGAFAAYYAVLETGSLLFGVMAALATGMLMGLVMAFVSVTLQAEQGISGIGLYLFGLGLSDMLYQRLVGTPVHVDGFPRVDIPVLTDLPVLGEIFFNHNFLVYVAFASVPLSAFVLTRTTFGLKIRAVGQNPEAADAMGVNVARIRYFTVIIGGAFSGIAGASLSIALVNFFQGNLTAGKGFIAVALVYFGAWRPYWVMAGTLLFSTVDALQLQIKTLENALNLDIPNELAVMAPYVVTLVALIFASKGVEKPTALTKPFERGE
ncbi:MAG: ABC transporter permease [Chloroflexi bacterium]|nr:ABC transporter permease [Chloroflexota bacterium]